MNAGACDWSARAGLTRKRSTPAWQGRDESPSLNRCSQENSASRVPRLGRLTKGENMNPRILRLTALALAALALTALTADARPRRDRGDRHWEVLGTLT